MDVHWPIIHDLLGSLACPTWCMLVGFLFQPADSCPTFNLQALGMRVGQDLADSSNAQVPATAFLSSCVTCGGQACRSRAAAALKRQAPVLEKELLGFCLRVSERKNVLYPSLPHAVLHTALLKQCSERGCRVPSVSSEDNWKCYSRVTVLPAA